ncbi:hypothetical protein SAMN04488587_1927 [Methanococcoides vulcani]|uniref:Uncharacterized protein n=1 Tax=Methanococcoides vulcani TaxID=1353158 RepID=A0A1I0B2T6_9EURY|nr:hypothetical protein [Methanococcoides vulcani]SET01036.1 hypothetical protein SAMN04488587_1927 [Methanococcoides vulcani]
MELIPYFHVLVGILIFIVGFIFHWVGQLISVLNWDYATKIGLQEKRMLPEFKVYEHAIAVADVSIGWIYGIVAIGLIMNLPWAFKLAWIPGVILVYHSLSYWFWIGNQNKLGHNTNTERFRIIWFFSNFITGILAIAIAW